MSKYTEFKKLHRKEWSLVEKENNAKRSGFLGGKPPDMIPWHPLPMMEEYLEYVRDVQIDKGRSDHYVADAKRELSWFGIYCIQNGFSHPEEIRRVDILKYMSWLPEQDSRNPLISKKISVQYQRTLTGRVKHWFKWMWQNNYVLEDPFKDITIPPVAKVRKPNPLTEEEVSSIFDVHRRQAFRIAPFYYHRRDVMLTLLYGWGLKVQELTALTVPRVNISQEFVRIPTHAGNVKNLPYPPEMKEAVARWLALRATKAIVGQDALIIDTKGYPMSSLMVFSILKDLGDKAGVTLNATRLRDSFGARLMENETPPERIASMMGNANTKTIFALTEEMRRDREEHQEVIAPMLRKLTGGIQI